MEASRAWVLLVGDGTRVEYAPELYLNESAARREAYRWASTLSEIPDGSIRRRDASHWSVGFRDVLLVETRAGTLGPIWIISRGKGPLGQGTSIQIATDRTEAFRQVRRWALLNQSEFAATGVSTWSAQGESWIDAQQAKVCGC